MDSKKSTARVAKDVRSSTSNAARSTERSQILSKRPSAPPPSLVAKKRERSSLPPPLADNDNSTLARSSARFDSVREENDRDDDLDEAPRKAAPAPLSAAKPAGSAVTTLPRTRLPTGSLHTEARTPAAAESIKQRLTTLMNTQLRLGELKRSSQKHFYEIGELLHRIRDQRLYEVKGYSSLEAFIEREVNLGQTFCMQSVRIFETFLPAAVQAHGFHRLATALEALEPSPTSTSSGSSSHSSSDAARMARSPIPPHKL